MSEISRNVSITTLKNQYRNIVGRQPRAKNESESYNAYKNVLVNELLQRPNITLKFGERVSKNKPIDSSNGKVGRPRTLNSNRDRVCEIVSKGKNTNKVAEQNYECKKSIRQQPMIEVKQDFISIDELQGLAEDGLRRIITALIPIRQRNKQILQERYNAKRGVLNDLTRPQLLNLLRENNITQISSDDAVRILRYRGKA